MRKLRCRLGAFPKLLGSSAPPLPSPQVRLGETIFKGHRSYDLMLNLQVIGRGVGWKRQAGERCRQGGLG